MQTIVSGHAKHAMITMRVPISLTEITHGFSLQKIIEKHLIF